MFTYKLKFILLFQLLTMYIHCLNWLVSTGLLFQSAFCRPCKSTTGERHQWSAPVWKWGPDMASTVSAHLSMPFGGIFALWGTSTCHSHSKLYYCVIMHHCLSFCHYPPHPCASPTHSLIYGYVVCRFVIVII